MIKEQQPLFNKRLRRNKQLCAWLLADDRPQIVYAREVDFSHQQHLYGLFANRRAALQMLQSLADEQRLCYGLLGLEPLSRGRACFRSALPLRRGLLWKGERGGAQRAPAGADEQTAAGVLAVGGARGAGGARPGHDAVSRHS